MYDRNTSGCGRSIAWLATLALAPMVALLPAPARATTKGLSQIVTPDLQPAGQLSLSLQAQDRAIGNPWQAQAELGLNDWAEVAAFQGFSPDEQFAAAEFGLLRNQPFLLSTGFLAWSSKGDSPQPFLEAGWYTEHAKLIAGLQRVGARDEAVLGFAWDFNAHWRTQVDFQGGQDNSTTFGITWTPSDSWQFNPALYRSNGPGHELRGYIVASYSMALWRH
jgi:hypothetical protein